MRGLAAREQAYADQRRTYEARVVAYNAEVDRFATALAGAEPTSVVEYFSMVLGNSVYPDDFPQRYRLAFLPHPNLEKLLPQLDVPAHVMTLSYEGIAAASDKGNPRCGAYWRRMRQCRTKCERRKGPGRHSTIAHQRG